MRIIYIFIKIIEIVYWFSS